MADAPKLLGTDTLRTAYPKVNMAIDNANEALRNSEEALNTANQALANSENTQAQLDQIVIEGDSSVEAAQARVDADGNVFTTLKERLDTKETQFANEIGILKKKTDGIVSVKEFGAKGDGVTDDTQAIQNAMNQSGTIIFEKDKTYLVTDCILIGDNVRKIDGNGAKIIFTREQQGSISSVVNSLFNAFNRNCPITIENIVLEYKGTFDFGYSYSGYVSGIDIRSSSGFVGLHIRNVEAFGFNRAGIQLAHGGEYIKNVVVENCYLHHNRVAGIWFGNVDGIILRGNRCEYNGIATDAGTGYGMSGISDYYPKNVDVVNNFCNNNFRKGIDFHSGYNINIDGNICENNRYFGIYVKCKNIVNGQAQPIGSIRIVNNVIRNMANHSDPLLTTLNAIVVGKYDLPETTDYKTNIIISGNTIDNLDSSGTGILEVISIQPTGLRDCEVIISKNIIRCGRCNYVVSFAASDQSASTTNSKLIMESNICEIETIVTRFLRLTPGLNVKTIKFSNNYVKINNSSSAFKTTGFFNFISAYGSLPSDTNVDFSDNDVFVLDMTKSFVVDIIELYGRYNQIKVSGNTFNGKKYRDYRNEFYHSIDTNIPNRGLWLKGSFIQKSGAGEGENFGWFCTQTGYACDVQWSPGTSYNVDDVVYYQNRVYQATTSGTSGATPPTHTSGTVSDGGVSWKYVGGLAVFKPYGVI